MNFSYDIQQRTNKDDYALLFMAAFVAGIVFQWIV